MLKLIMKSLMTNINVDITVNTIGNTKFSINVSLETKNCNINKNVSSGEDIDGYDIRNTYFNEFKV